ncbi:transcriptional regulator TbsP [Halomicroarcula sp. GCM10025324]|uniref:transcriptional regulator TbsP n=1 Tax=Haloarcula TaxID=2237 RepID=UPI0023E8B642|nr:DUF5821 family protein [Halomicroarcula sp. ZS-22-S1]
MSTNLLQDDIGTILTSVFDAGETLYVVNPSGETISEFITTLEDSSAHPEVRMLAEERVLKDIMDDFILASTAADLIEAETLALRLLADGPNHSIAVTSDEVYALVTVGDSVAGLGTDDDEFVGDVFGFYADVWDDAEAFSLRTPPLSLVQETLESDIGSETAADFDAVLGSLATARGDGDGLDEVTIALLVAAKNGELLYDISKWGEDIGLASKATFSRTKTKLEDMGLIDTEKVPIDVGRPRLRLMLGDERLKGADTDDLASITQSILAA